MGKKKSSWMIFATGLALRLVKRDGVVTLVALADELTKQQRVYRSRHRNASGAAIRAERRIVGGDMISTRGDRANHYAKSIAIALEREGLVTLRRNYAGGVDCLVDR